MLRIGLCGTFDVQNYGDLLFPIVAETELTRRLGQIELYRFSYYDKAPPEWPFTVTSLTKLPSIAGALDGIIVGGGDLIRFDKDVATGYHPPAPYIHHPTGYWLAPALCALRYGCAVAWNAPGVVGDVPEWAAQMMQLVVQRSNYVAVRDEASRDRLTPYAGGRDIGVVPDTAFGIARLIDRQCPSAGFLKLRQALGFTGPYILVQPTYGLSPFTRLLQNHPERFADYRIISLPISPALGDWNALLRDEIKNLVSVSPWPDPLLIAELIGASECVVGSSLHLAVTAIALGVPAFMPASKSIVKHLVLREYDQNHTFADQIDPDWFTERVAKRSSGSKMLGVLQSLDKHWNNVVSCLSPPRRMLRETTYDAGISANQDIASERTKLQAAIAERDLQLAALSSAVRDREDAIIAMQDSTSWKVTSPLRWLGRKLANFSSWKLTAPLRWLGRTSKRSVRPEIIRLAEINRHPISKVPYEWAFVNELFSKRDAETLVRTYPRDHFKTVKGYDGEKGYEYEARALIHLGAKSVAFTEGLSDAWQKLANDLLSLEYRDALTRLTGRNLMRVPMEAYVCHFGPAAWLGPHLDLKAKLLTHVFYFNESWNKEDGGCLNILRSANESDSLAEIAPIVGNSSILIRSDNSWHSVSRVVNGCRTSRRSMNVIFFHPGAVSTMWPAGDTAPLHRYEPPEV